MITRNNNMTVTLPLTQFDEMERELKELRERVARSEITVKITQTATRLSSRRFDSSFDSVIHTYPYLQINAGSEIIADMKDTLQTMVDVWTVDQETNHKAINAELEEIKKNQQLIEEQANIIEVNTYDLSRRIQSFNDHIEEIDNHNGFLKRLVIGDVRKYYYKLKV